MSYDFIAGSIAGVMPIARGSGLFVDRISFQMPDGILGNAGEPSGDYLDVAGLTNIPCMDAPQPFSEARISASKVRTPTEVEEISSRHVLLNDWYPTVEVNWRYGMRAVIAGVQFDMCAAESDSQHTQTRLELKEITFGAVVAP